MNRHMKIVIYVCLATEVTAFMWLVALRSSASVLLALLITISVVVVIQCSCINPVVTVTAIPPTPMPHVEVPAADMPTGTDCVICLCPLDNLDVTCSPPPHQKIYMLSCGHRFHSKCIEEWWTVAHQCPFQCVSVVQEHPLATAIV